MPVNPLNVDAPQLLPNYSSLPPMPPATASTSWRYRSALAPLAQQPVIHACPLTPAQAALSHALGVYGMAQPTFAIWQPPQLP